MAFKKNLNIMLGETLDMSFATYQHKKIHHHPLQQKLAKRKRYQANSLFIKLYFK